MVHLEDQRRIGLFGVAHLDPKQAVAFMDRIRAHAGDMRDFLDSRNPSTGACAVECQTVIAAFNRVEMCIRDRAGKAATFGLTIRAADAAPGFGWILGEAVITDPIRWRSLVASNTAAIRPAPDLQAGLRNSSPCLLYTSRCV